MRFETKYLNVKTELNSTSNLYGIFKHHIDCVGRPNNVAFHQCFADVGSH